MGSVVEQLWHNVQKTADRAALVDEGGDLTYAEMVRAAASLSENFRRRGLLPGSRFAVQLPNCREFVLCYLAALYGGYTIVPISPAIPLRDREYILALTQPSLIVQSTDDLSFDAPSSRKPATDASMAFAISFTSGSTSRPKGVVHTAGGILTNVFSFNTLVGLDDSVRMLHVMPMAYMAGWLNTILSPFAAGGAVVCASQFSAATVTAFWTAAKSANANAVWLSPTMVTLLTQLSRDTHNMTSPVTRLRYVFVGTAPLALATAIAFQATFGIHCIPSYGMTEVALVSSQRLGFRNASGSVGQLLDQVHIEARDEIGVVLPPGVAGQLWISTPHAMKGYLDPDSRDLVSPAHDGWLDTGDVGYLNEDHELFITGRLKDVIIRGGVNISPQAVEDALLQVPGVIEAAVVGIPHSFWGEEIVAFLVVAAGTDSSIAAIRSACSTSLGTESLPSRINVVKGLPRSETGKVQKHVLKSSI